MTSMPLIGSWLPIAGRIIILSFPLVFLSILFNQQAFTCKEIIPVYIFILVMYCGNSKNEYVNHFWQLTTATLLSMSIISYYVRKSNNQKVLQWIVYLTICFISITSAASIIIDHMNPGIIRRIGSSSSEEFQSALAYTYSRMGLSDYLLPHAIPMLIAPLCMYARYPERTGINKYIIYLCILLIVYFEWIAQSTTALLFVIFSIIACYSITSDDAKTNKTRLFILLVALIILSNDFVMLSLIDNIKSIAPESYHLKLNDLQASILGENNSSHFYGRMDLYSISLDTFFRNPIWGYSGNDLPIGGHSAMIDYLAVYGLIGFIPWICIIIFQIKSVWYQIDNKYRLFYAISCICFLGMLILKNMSVPIVWTTFLVFVPVFMIYKKGNK